MQTGLYTPITKQMQQISLLAFFGANISKNKRQTMKYCTNSKFSYQQFPKEQKILLMNEMHIFDIITDCFNTFSTHRKSLFMASVPGKLYNLLTHAKFHDFYSQSKTFFVPLKGYNVTREEIGHLSNSITFI